MADSDVRIEVCIDSGKVEQKVKNDSFGLMMATEWHRLISPYTPRDTGMLIQTAEKKPFQIEYIQKYSATDYYDSNRNFRKDKSPFACAYWDKNAAQSGQKDKLARTMNAYLKRH